MHVHKYTSSLQNPIMSSSPGGIARYPWVKIELLCLQLLLLEEDLSVHRVWAGRVRVKTGGGWGLDGWSDQLQLRVCQVVLLTCLRLPTARGNLVRGERLQTCTCLSPECRTGLEGKIQTARLMMRHFKWVSFILYPLAPAPIECMILVCPTTVCVWSASMILNQNMFSWFYCPQKNYKTSHFDDVGLYSIFIIPWNIFACPRNVHPVIMG